MMTERSHRFGKHDRLTMDGATFRVTRKVRDRHHLQLVIEGATQDHFEVKTDADINELFRRRRLTVEVGYYSRALRLLRTGHDDTDVIDLDEADLRTIAWKREWCVQFNLARTDVDAETRPGMSLKDMAAFIEANKRTMESWYIRTFKERRPLGRTQRDGEKKEFDYPSPGALRDWLAKWKLHRCKVSAFILNYGNCGNRRQIDPKALEIVERRVREYAGSRKFKKVDVWSNIEGDLHLLNEGKPEAEHITVGQTAVLRRINKMEPFKLMAGREGIDRALREFTPVGHGVDITQLLERVEMDDWEMDLHVLIERSSVWKNLTKKQRDLVPRARCTATVAIDVASRAIVGFNLTKDSPSPAGSKSALRSILVDKTDFARWARAESPWPMHGRLVALATDGGPAFKGDFAASMMRCRLQHLLPEKDPRKRGTIEAFFRFFRRLCRYFAGQAFSNVVEKGDYDAEAMASLTFDETYRLAVRFIVDLYHHRRHRGLEGRTPFAVWNERQKKQGLRPTLGADEIIYGFGIRTKATIDKHGVLYRGNSYQGTYGPGAGGANLIAALHRILPDPEVDVFIDPFDLKTILVRVPKDYRGHLELGDRDFVLAECLEEAVHGRTLEELLMADKEVRAFIKKEEAAGRPIRIRAHIDLAAEGEMARIRAGHPEFSLTQEAYDRVVSAIGHMGRAGIEGVEYGADPIDDEEPFGTLVAEAQRTGADEDGGPPSVSRRAEREPPSGGSINCFDEEDEE